MSALPGGPQNRYHVTNSQFIRESGLKNVRRRTQGLIGRTSMQITCTRAVATIIAFAIISWAATLATSSASAQTTASNELQRSTGVYAYAMAGKSGAVRGEVLYYYKCWFCHNDYARAAGSPAPALKDIFKRA